MPSLNEQMLLGFRDELRKMAFAPPDLAVMRQGLASAGQLLSRGARAAGGAIQRGAGAAGTGAALGGVAGGAVGAATKGYQGYQQAKEQGASSGQALAHGVLGGIGGITSGAMIGAGVGGAAGAAAHAINPEMAAKLVDRARSTAGIGGVARYGQAQAHTLTGWNPPSGLKDLNIGAAPVAQRAMEARARAKALEEGVAGDPQGIFGHARRALLGEKNDLAWQKYTARNEADRLSKAYTYAKRNEEAGMTNIPGYLSALKNDPTGTLGNAFKQRWHEQGALGKAMMVGLPAMGAVNELRSDDPNKGTGERLLGATGAALGSFAFSPMTNTADAVLGTNLGRATSLLGRSVDRVAGFNPKQEVAPGYSAQELRRSGAGALLPIRPPGTDVEEHNVGAPVERIETDRFRGMAPEGGAG